MPTSTAVSKEAEVQESSIPVNEKSKKIKKKKKSKFKIVIIVLVVILVFCGGAFAVGKLNLFGAGDKMAKLPLVGGLFESSNDGTDVLSLEVSSVSKLSKSKLKDELIRQLTINDKLQTKLNKSDDKDTELTTKFNEANLSLTQYKNDYNGIKKQYNSNLKRISELEKALAKADPSLFIQQYEKLNPDVAKEYYNAIKQEEDKKAALESNYTKMTTYYVKMDASAASAAILKLYKSNKTLAIGIMSRMAEKKLAEIFGAMDSDSVQKITQDLYLEGVKKAQNSGVNN